MPGEEILIVEDEAKIARLLEEYLRLDGFTVSWLPEGRAALERVRERPPALVILDLMLPDSDGIEICRALRQFSAVPVLMLTARIDEIDRIVGLRVGADDYVCKPFSPREVVARVQSILRRVQQTEVAQAETELSYAGIRLVPAHFLCEVAGRPVELTPSEFRLLATFLAHPGRVFTRERLMRAAYADDRIVNDRTIDTHIKNLRKKLTGAGAERDCIQAIYGVGYKLEASTDARAAAEDHSAASKPSRG